MSCDNARRSRICVNRDRLRCGFHQAMKASLLQRGYNNLSWFLSWRVFGSFPRKTACHGVSSSSTCHQAAITCLACGAYAQVIRGSVPSVIFTI